MTVESTQTVEAVAPSSPTYPQILATFTGADAMRAKDICLALGLDIIPKNTKAYAPSRSRHAVTNYPLPAWANAVRLFQRPSRAASMPFTAARSKEPGSAGPDSPASSEAQTSSSGYSTGESPLNFVHTG